MKKGGSGEELTEKKEYKKNKTKQNKTFTNGQTFVYFMMFCKPVN